MKTVNGKNLVVWIPGLTVESTLNKREHHMARAKRAKSQREQVRTALENVKPPQLDKNGPTSSL